jgi:hypothetical protein
VGDKAPVRVSVRHGELVPSEAKDIVQTTTTAQGLPEVIEDQSALEDIADVVWPTE